MGLWMPELKVSVFLKVVFALIFAAYIYVAWIVTPGQHLRAIDVVDLIAILNADDSLRYFFARQAWSGADVYSWGYILPVGLLLDGLLASFFAGDIFLMRFAHAFFSFLGLYFLYRAKLNFGAPRGLSALATMILAVMPVYCLVSLSFLGESWMMLFISVSLYLFSCRRYEASALMIAFLPLIRAEGLLLVVPAAVYFLYLRRHSIVFILGAPGFLYFCWLIIAIPNFGDYFGWRIQYRQFFNHIHFPFLYDIRSFFVTYNALWILPGVAAALALRQLREAWPFTVGAFLLVLFFFVLIAQEKAFYEPRYFASLLPLFSLWWVIGMNKLLALLDMKGWSSVRKRAVITFVGGFICVNHFLQNDYLRAALTDGIRLPFFKGQEFYSHDNGLDTKSVSNISDIVGLLSDVKRVNPHVSTLFVPTQQDVFYVLGSADLSDLKVVMLPLAYGNFVRIFGGSIFGMYPGGRQYSYYNFYEVGGSGGSQLGLYLGDLSSCAVCTPIIKKGNVGLYPLFFDETTMPLRIPAEDEVYIVAP